MYINETVVYIPKNKNTGYPFPFIFYIIIGGNSNDTAIAA